MIMSGIYRFAVLTMHSYSARFRIRVSVLPLQVFRDV